MSPVSFPDALRLLLDSVTPVGAEMVPISAALNRVVAEPVVAPQAIPNSRRSAVDGFALGSLESGQWHIIGQRAAGELALQPLAPHETLAVMTGGGVPENAQAVVRIEDTRQQANALSVSSEVIAGDNINDVGSELLAGQTLLNPGSRLDPVRYSALCYAGIREVAVYQPLRVGIMLSGAELLPPGEPPQPGAGYECHRALLQPILEQLGCHCTFVGPVRDEPNVVRDTVEYLAADHDLIVTSGGVSMGKYDYVRPLLHQQDFELILDRTKIKPGRPLLAARRRNRMFLGMPGYPAAFLVNLFLYLIPVVKRMSGWSHYAPIWRDVVLNQPLHGRAGRSDMIRVRRCAEKAEPLAGQLTSHYVGFLAADGLAWLDETRSHAIAGESVSVCWLDGI